MKAPGFLPGFFSGWGGKIYCYANFFRYANFSIVVGPNFRGGGKSPKDRGQTASGGRSPATHCERKPGLSVI